MLEKITTSEPHLLDFILPMLSDIYAMYLEYLNAWIHFNLGNMNESETTSFTKKPPRTQLPTTGYGSEQIDSKCEQYDSTLNEQIL